MFFEANRSSREGLIAIETVVMNCVHPHNIRIRSAVWWGRRAFASGVLTRAMSWQALPDCTGCCRCCSVGECHSRLRNAMFFHTAGLSFLYKNMHYMLVTDSNAFYEKRRRNGSLNVPVNDRFYDTVYAFDRKAPVQRRYFPVLRIRLQHSWCLTI